MMNDGQKYIKDGEVLWETYMFDDKVFYIVVTENRLRDEYILYQIIGNRRKKIKSSNNPVDFHKVINKRENKVQEGGDTSADNINYVK